MIKRETETTNRDFEPPQGPSILEIGSGSNPLFIKWAGYPDLKKLMPDSARFTLVDINSDAVRITKELLKRNEYKKFNDNTQVILANGMSIELPPESFDRVFLSDIVTERVLPSNEPYTVGTSSDYTHTRIDSQVEFGNMEKLVSNALHLLKINGQLIIANRAGLIDRRALTMLKESLMSDQSLKMNSYIANPEQKNDTSKPPASVWELTKLK